LLLNMLMVSAVVIVAFLVILTTTYSRVLSENRDKLLYTPPLRPVSVYGGMLRQEGVLFAEYGTGGPVVSGFSGRISPYAGLSFSILVDSNNDVIEVNSMVDLPSEAYARVAAQAMESANGTETITLEGRRWQYLVSPITLLFNEAFGTGVMTTAISEEFRQIRFLDVTDSYRMIQSLALVLVVLTLVILTLFFFISLYFANRAIRPMEEAWEKQSRFITDASHELKTPLSIINANCDVLYTGKEETVESQIKWVDSILRATDRMTGLVGRLLSIAHMEDAQQTMQSISFDMSTLVSGAVDEVDAFAIEKG